MRKKLYRYASNLVARASGTPPYLIFFVSRSCPNKCRHCWYNNGWKEENLSGSDLTFDEIIEISRHIKSVRFLSLTGGEAFIRSDIAEIAQAFSNNAKVGRLDIPTSGFDPEMILYKTDKILKLTGNTPFRVDVSLDGSETTHNFIRRNDNAFNNAVRTISLLKELRRKNNRLDISIITTISEHNAQEVGWLGDFTGDLLPDGEWMVNIERGNEPRSKTPEVVLGSYIKANTIIENRLKDHKFGGDKGHRLGKWLTAKNILRREMIIRTVGGERGGGGCAAGSLAGVIFNDGDVRPCETLTHSFGNIRDYNYSLADAWSSVAADESRRIIQDSGCVCTHECFLSVSTLFQPGCWPRLLSNRMRLGI